MLTSSVALLGEEIHQRARSRLTDVLVNGNGWQWVAMGGHEGHEGHEGGSLRKNTHQLLLGHAGQIQMAACTTTANRRHSSLRKIVGAENNGGGGGGTLNIIIMTSITLNCSLPYV